VVPEGASLPADPRKYIRLAAVLRGRILDGTLRPGDCAPSITTLAAEHGGWARQTCAKAFRMLEAEGLLVRVQGLGYFINGPAAGTQPGRADQPSFYREQLQMIRRESILASVLRIEAALPARLKVSVTVRGGRRPPRKKTGGRKAARSIRPARPSGMDMAIPFLDLFREEFFVALGQSLAWSDQDAQEFWHDLELYEMLAAREPARPAGRAWASGGPISGWRSSPT